MLNHHRPLRVAVLCSHRAPGLLYLLNRAPDRGATFEITCVMTSERTFDEEVRVERRGIPTLAHPIRDFYAARGHTTRRDMATRAAYDAETLKMIEPYLADLLLLDGYLYLVTDPLLRAFPGRVINLHFADLNEREADGHPRFPGIHAVRDTLMAGRSETRATVHFVDREPDAGPPILRSRPFPVSPLVDDLRTDDVHDAFKAYAFAHEQWMMRTASGPLVADALRLIATGQIDAQGRMLTGAHALAVA